jgi:hypothetical protein
MKILYISQGIEHTGDGVDMLKDMIFHGLCKQFGEENVIDVHPLKLMYKEFLDTPEKRHKAPYKAFTTYGLLDQYTKDREDIESKIRAHYFDLVIYGSIHRCQDYFELVYEHYSPTEIAVLDGEDHTVLAQGFRRVPYFKRELIGEPEVVYPIGFSFPKEKLVDPRNIIKEKDTAFIIPGNLNTYIYEDEVAYYHDYQISKWGITMRKGGWDCMRHYEILGNYCMPMFIGIQACPPNIMTFWPKQELLDVQLNPERYWELLNSAFDKFQKDLTTEAMSLYIINKLRSL